MSTNNRSDKRGQPASLASDILPFRRADQAPGDGVHSKPLFIRRSGHAVWIGDNPGTWNQWPSGT